MRARTRRIHNIMIGSYEKGRSGENYLLNMMGELMKIGLRAREKGEKWCLIFSMLGFLPLLVLQGE